ncbi:trehalose-6-phosphate hydrolase [Bacillus ectoiniformans]|uniref:alpha,alpha-phosphotrehalase n=1 Tax=Bacillus ectoiniformans TaxID=1494429 RepID=UPI0030844C90|nr:trehalose-6-phosphate hydrolase [Bacillus ectoiniformans]
MKWWEKAVIYQIYPKSFADANGDGIGDLKGVLTKLDYLSELGVDAIWLTPVYCSPQRDNGYDISDYIQIDPLFGTMEDFDQLLSAAHKKGIKIIMDIVVNHTSDEHSWFKKALADSDSPYRDYYIFKDGKEGGAPNNWTSFFGGSAWKQAPDGQYYLHLFDESQPDLNWENESLRQELYEMMRYWLEKGVDGFRLDVINLISKEQSFADDASDATSKGKSSFVHGPRLHEYLREMNHEVFAPYQAMTVGEMMSMTPELAVDYTKQEHEELDMVFMFNHMQVDQEGEKWNVKPFDFIQLKTILSEWQVKLLEHGCSNALYWSNHDQPRVLSRFGDEGECRIQSAKMLATALHMLSGTPYIYQGEEIGMTNAHFDSLSDYRDVETFNIYEERKAKGMPHEAIMKGIKAMSRDNSRTPMQWDDTEHAGFTAGDPWIRAMDNYQEINVENALNDPDSIFYHYQTLIRLRKELEVISTGNYIPLHLDHPSVWAYARINSKEAVVVVNNFYKEETDFIIPFELLPKLKNPQIILSNEKQSPLPGESGKLHLKPYESIVYQYER